MKKFLLCLVMLGILFLPSKVDAQEKVKVYMFRSLSCNHCESALDYLEDHKDIFGDDIEFITFEVSKNGSNSKLLAELGERFNLEEKQKKNVPFFVVGDQYVLGYGSNTFENVISEAKEYVEGKKDYKDVVLEVQNELKKENGNLDFETLDLNDLFPEPNKVVTIVVYGIFGIAILGFVGMIVFSRKN